MKTETHLEMHTDGAFEGVALILLPSFESLDVSNIGFLGGELRVDTVPYPQGFDETELTSRDAHRHRSSMVGLGLDNSWDCCVIHGTRYLHEVTKVTAGQRMSIGVNFKACVKSTTHTLSLDNVIISDKPRTKR